jgi:hypothetical protein
LTAILPGIVCLVKSVVTRDRDMMGFPLFFPWFSPVCQTVFFARIDRWYQSQELDRDTKGFEIRNFQFRGKMINSLSLERHRAHDDDLRRAYLASSGS